MSCVRCGGPETGEPLCRMCEAAVEYEQDRDDEFEVGRPFAVRELPEEDEAAA